MYLGLVLAYIDIGSVQVKVQFNQLFYYHFLDELEHFKLRLWYKLSSIHPYTNPPTPWMSGGMALCALSAF